jgi:hypothetical protein
MENIKQNNIGKFLKATLGIFLASAIVAIVGFALTSNAEKADFVLAELTKTLEIKAGELKEAKELEEQLKVSYEQATKARELKQEEKKNAMNAIDDYVNSGLNTENTIKSVDNTQKQAVSFTKAENK